MKEFYPTRVRIYSKLLSSDSMVISSAICINKLVADIESELILIPINAGLAEWITGQGRLAKGIKNE